jgi:hypothetical protein
MSSNPLVQELISHIDAADHPDTLQVIFNWTAAKLAEEVSFHARHLSRV